MGFLQFLSIDAFVLFWIAAFVPRLVFQPMYRKKLLILFYLLLVFMVWEFVKKCAVQFMTVSLKLGSGLFSNLRFASKTFSSSKIGFLCLWDPRPSIVYSVVTVMLPTWGNLNDLSTLGSQNTGESLPERAKRSPTLANLLFWTIASKPAILLHPLIFLF